jgi:hypothetical protein
MSRTEMPSAAISVRSAFTGYKPRVFPSTIVPISRFALSSFSARLDGISIRIDVGRACSSLTCCFPKGSVPSFLLETKMEAL